MQIEIQGQDAVQATEELLSILMEKGLEGSYEIFEEVEQGDVNTTLATIAASVVIASGMVNVAEQIYQWKERYFQNPTEPRIEKVLLVATNGNRLLLKNATVEQIQEILGDLK